MPETRDRFGRVDREGDQRLGWHFLEEPHCHVASGREFVETQTISYTVVGAGSTRQVKARELRRRNLCLLCLDARDLLREEVERY
jgi:hypothetical protein